MPATAATAARSAASGGIGAEYDNYWNTVQNNEFDMWQNGG